VNVRLQLNVPAKVAAGGLVSAVGSASAVLVPASTTTLVPESSPRVGAVPESTSYPSPPLLSPLLSLPEPEPDPRLPWLLVEAKPLELLFGAELHAIGRRNVAARAQRVSVEKRWSTMRAR